MAQYNRQPILPVIMVAAGVVLILGAVFWSMNIGQTQANSETVDDLPIQPQASTFTLTTPTGVNAPRIPSPEITRISPAEAKAALDSGAAVFVDTRGEPYYSQGHIPGAVSMPIPEASDKIGSLDPNSWIITYCT